jgi:hypothetical protein
LVFPVDFAVGIVEGVVSAHFENGEVSAEGWSRVGDVYEANARLGYHQWVGWWWCDAFGDVGLEVDYACVGQVDVASPSGYDWVWFDACVVVLFEKREERFAHFRQCVAVSCGRIFQKSVAGASV